MNQTFYSNGKLFITGEYVVLDGGIAFSLSTKFGQNLIAEENENDYIYWKSYDSDDSIWFEERISISDILEKNTTGIQAKDTLIEILHQANLMNPEILQRKTGFDVTTELTFPRNWGLGTSSTLINNIAQWFQINAFELLNKSFGGSGYDIANAQNNTPILYRIINGKPQVRQISFEPSFLKNIYFVYLNQKQNSKEAIASYNKKKKTIAPIVKQIDNITQKAISTADLNEFINLMTKHELVLSSILEIEPVQKRLFLDFKGVVKSLGAWGGDFVMAVSEENPTEYFRKKGFETILSYEEMIL